MNFKEKYPDFAAIEGHIHAARLERAVYLSQVIVDAVQATIDGVKRLGAYVGGSVPAERNAFPKGPVPRY